MAQQPRCCGRAHGILTGTRATRERELAAEEEKTVPGRYYVPYTDIYENLRRPTTVVDGDAGGGKKDLA